MEEGEQRLDQGVCLRKVLVKVPTLTTQGRLLLEEVFPQTPLLWGKTLSHLPSLGVTGRPAGQQM